MHKVIKFNVKGDDRGDLVSLEELTHQVPFEIKRVYYIYNTDHDVVRGKHAHKELYQVLIAVSGYVTIKLDDGVNKHYIMLNSPSEGLQIGPGLWREMMHFSDDAVLLVLASEKYDEDDYIRDYPKFLEYVL